MTALSPSTPGCSAAAPQRPSNLRGDLPLPPWVDAELDRAAAASNTHQDQPTSFSADGHSVQLRDAGRLALLTTRIHDATTLDAAELRRAVTEAYQSLCRAASRLQARHLIRLWNFIPAIHEPLADGLDRYRVFNLGRFDAFARILGGSDAFAHGLPTATGVGHAGADLAIHALAAAEPGLHVENPRQTPAYRYSANHGPRPPCFARATIARDPVRLLVGGTSSVRQEDSVHAGDIAGQLAETLDNLTALINAGRKRLDPAAPEETSDRTLARFTCLRVYHVASSDERLIRDTLACRVPHLRPETLLADICRRELSVEIEGVVDLSATPTPASPSNQLHPPLS